MRVALRELRELIQRVLVESYVLADKSEGAERYRVFGLTAYTGSGGTANDTGKLLIAPIEMGAYTSAGIDGLLDSMGLRPRAPAGASDEERAENNKRYHNAGVLFVVDVSKSVIDLGDATKFNDYKGRRPKNNKSYVIPHEGVSGDNLLKLQKSLKAIMHHDRRVTGDFSIVGNPKYESMTIADVLQMKDVGNQIAKGGHFEPVKLYHGTSEKRWQEIKRAGLRPGKAPEVYVDLVKGFSEHNVYLTTSVHEAENYATRAAVDDKSKAVVLEVTIRDPHKFIFDEDGANWLTIEAPGPPWTKRPKGEEMQIHFRHVYVKDDGGSNYWQDWPNAGKIWAAYQAKLIKNLHRAGTIGYKGAIPARDIKLFSTYKPASMKKDPDSAEFDAARDRTMQTYKRS